MALNCEIADVMHFDRKHYFYPDNPKAYQISQEDRPIGERGWVEIEVDGKKKKIRLNRIHLEEDAGKLTHTDQGYSLVDLNRQGTPLIEIVSEADIRSADEAYAFLEKLKAIVEYTGVSDVRMEEGSLRCDANISLRPFGQEEFGTKTQLKNLNSFNFVRRGIKKKLNDKRKFYYQAVKSNKKHVVMMKPLVKLSLCESKDQRMIIVSLMIQIYLKFISTKHGKSVFVLKFQNFQMHVKNVISMTLILPDYDAMVLTLTKEMSDFFEATVTAGADPKLASNWLMGEVSAYLNAERKELDATALTPEGLSKYD